MNIFNLKPMFLEDSLDTGRFIIYVVIGLVATILLIVLLFLFDKYYFAKRRCKSQLRSLENKFEYLKSLLTGQDFQYVQRIEIISRTNLLYADIYSNYLKRYNDLHNNSENEVNDIMNELTKALNKTNIKEFKKKYKQALVLINNFEELVNNFNDDLLGVIKPEEDARQNSLVLKDRFREVKSKYNLKEEELSFVNETFNRVFSLIDEKFAQFENLIETADYDEANSLLPEVSKVLKVSDKLIDAMPILIKRTNEIVPNELNSLKTHYDNLIANGYPLKHVGFDKIYTEVSTSLEDLRKELLELKTAGIDQKLNNLEELIRNTEDLLIKEEEAASEYNSNVDHVYSAFNNLETEFIKVRNNMIKYSKYYIVDDVHQAELKDIQKELDDVSKDKRRLDMYVHSIEKTPYTVLVVKMRDLDNGTNDLLDRFSKFKDYLASLKTDTETAFTLINELYFKLKECEAILRDFYNEEFSDKFNTDIDKSYKTIDDITILLRTVPINVNLVNLNIEDLKTRTDSVFSRVNEAKKYYDYCEQEIMYLNRERVKFSDINIQLSQAESLFLNGDYAQAETMVEDIKHKIESKDKLHD